MEVVFAHPKIQKFISSLELTVHAETVRVLELLETEGNNLRLPESRSLGGGLFELRVIDHVHVRMLYMFSGDGAVILHIFTKKTQAIPKKDLEYAKRMKKLYQEVIE